MARKLTWSVKDSDLDTGYAGVVTEANPDMTAAETFVGAIIALSDGDKASCELAETVRYTVDTTTMGDNAVEYRGTVILQNITTRRKYAITIPAISESNVDKQGTAALKVTDAAAETVRAAFVALISGTDTDYEVASSFIAVKDR